MSQKISEKFQVNVGKKQYQNDEAIFITGSANPFSKETVNLEVRDSLSNLVGIEQADVVEESDSYTAIVFPSHLWNVNGTYSMTATYGSSKDIANFDFLILPETIPQSPIAITPTQCLCQITSLFSVVAQALKAVLQKQNDQFQNLQHIEFVHHSNKEMLHSLH